MEYHVFTREITRAVDRLTVLPSDMVVTPHSLGDTVLLMDTPLGNEEVPPDCPSFWWDKIRMKNERNFAYSKENN